MPKVKAFQISGTDIWFWSNDHDPPHFHAKRSGEWEVKVSFLLDQPDMIEIIWSEKTPSNRSLNELTTLAENHRTRLLKQWEGIREKQG